LLHIVNLLIPVVQTDRFAVRYELNLEV